MNFEMLARAINVRRLHKCWNDGGSILSRWVMERYIQGSVLGQITLSQGPDHVEGNSQILKITCLYGGGARGVEDDGGF